MGGLFHSRKLTKKRPQLGGGCGRSSSVALSSGEAHPTIPRRALGNSSMGATYFVWTAANRGNDGTVRAVG